MNNLSKLSFRLTTEDFQYLESLTNTDLLKDVLCLQYPIKQVETRMVRGGHYYEVTLTIHKVDMADFKYTADHAPIIYKGPIKDRYSILVGDLIHAYSETIKAITDKVSRWQKRFYRGYRARVKADPDYKRSLRCQPMGQAYKNGYVWTPGKS